MTNLKELRVKKGLTQAELAEKVGVSENTIQNWENGKTVPKGDNWNQYLNALDITNFSEMQKIIGENSIPVSREEGIIIDNTPYFLFDKNSKDLEDIKNCYASAEELDMLGYADYISWNGKYGKREKRGDARFPLEFAFFEKYGGYNSTRKKMADARNRLGGLYRDALEFAEENPGKEFRLISLDEAVIVDMIAKFKNNNSYKQEVINLYNMLKTIESNGKVSTSINNLEMRMEKGREINRILQTSRDYMTGERNLGCLTGYVEFKDDEQDKNNISCLKLTERGMHLINWFDDINGVKNEK